MMRLDWDYIAIISLLLICWGVSYVNPGLVLAVLGSVGLAKALHQTWKEARAKEKE
jgi:hypothetical protein